MVRVMAPVMVTATLRVTGERRIFSSVLGSGLSPGRGCGRSGLGGSLTLRASPRRSRD